MSFVDFIDQVKEKTVQATQDQLSRLPCDFDLLYQAYLQGQIAPVTKEEVQKLILDFFSLKPSTGGSPSQQSDRPGTSSPRQQESIESKRRRFERSF